MIPLIGYDVSYQRNAFTTRIDPDGVPSRPLESLFERAARSVQANSDGRWIIIHKDEVISSNSDSTIELMVLVPTGIRQREQVLTAVAQFEEIITANTGIILDETLRSIEDDGPKCQICGKKPGWVRHTQFSGDHYFCAQHAKNEEDFGDSDPSYFVWKQLDPVST